MAGVLIATAPKYQEALRNIFAPENGTCQICGNAGQARRALGEGQAELLVVNAPLPDEFGRDLAVQAADSGMDVVLLCPASNAEKIAAGVEKYGIFVLPKPLSVQRAQFALRLIRTSRQRLKKLAEKNRRLTKQLDDVRVITQAKCALALCCGMTEEQAHHLIEKRAMNTRVSSKEAALQLLEDCERKLGHPL